MAINLLDGTVLVTWAHPFLDMSVQLTSRDAALSAVDLTLDPHLLQNVFLVLLPRVRVDKRAGASPGPFHVVGARITAGEWHLAMQAAVDIVKV